MPVDSGLAHVINDDEWNSHVSFTVVMENGNKVTANILRILCSVTVSEHGI